MRVKMVYKWVWKCAQNFHFSRGEGFDMACYQAVGSAIFPNQIFIFYFLIVGPEIKIQTIRCF